jgi:hypothetical protein
MNEHTFTKAINQSAKQAGLFVWKIDAASANGVPDCWYSGAKADLWIEFKFGGKYPVSKLQDKWLSDRHRDGRDCWVVTGFDDGTISVKTEPPFAQLSTNRVTKQQLLAMIRDHCLP